MHLRPATMDDASILFDWRNDPETRANSLYSGPVEWDGHCNWLAASLENPDRELLIAELNGYPVGTVRIDRGEETEISWTVAPGRRGRGVGKIMVALACPTGPAVCKIKPDNIASQKIAEAVGFEPIVEAPDVQIWSKGGDYLAIIDQIEAIRGRNNKNWMDLLRLAFRHSPKEAAEIMAGIYEQDAEISALVKRLTG